MDNWRPSEFWFGQVCQYQITRIRWPYSLVLLGGCKIGYSISARKCGTGEFGIFGGRIDPLGMTITPFTT